MLCHEQLIKCVVCKQMLFATILVCVLLNVVQLRFFATNFANAAMLFILLEMCD